MIKLKMSMNNSRAYWGESVFYGINKEEFAEVCDYSAENEIENFYKVAKNAVKEISEGEY